MVFLLELVCSAQCVTGRVVKGDRNDPGFQRGGALDWKIDRFSSLRLDPVA
jgi:hypothetical protein